MRIIDPHTGQPPVVEAGQSFTVEWTVVEDVVIPDGITDEGEPVLHAQVET